MSPKAPAVPVVALPDALRAAAAEVILERGLGAFSLREVARRAGVSHAAPGYHFGDSAGLLTSLAIEGFETLRAELAAAAAGETDPVERLGAVGRAYVRVARQFPAHCEVIFREDVVNADDPELQATGLAAFAVLQEAIQAVADAYNPRLDVLVASELCWSAMQGLVQLLPKLHHIDAVRGDVPKSVDERIAGFTAVIVHGLLAAPSLPARRSRRR